MSVIDELVRNNEIYAAQFGELLPPKPAKGLAVLTCMDARIDVYRLLGLADGDAHVLRNAGAVVTDDVIRSLAVSQRLMGTTSIMAISHTECGMRTFSDEEFRSDLEGRTGHRPPWPSEQFRDPETDVRASLVRIRESPFVPHTDGLRGFVFDVGTGRLREVTL
jgi:carbonic anhydrase